MLASIQGTSSVSSLASRTAGGFGAVSQGFQVPISTFASQRGLEFQAGASEAQSNAALFQALGQGAGQIGGAFALRSALASDRNLKVNIETSHNIKGLNIYTWDWVENASEEIKAQPKIGFVAQEVEITFPQYVTKDEDGFYRIDYDGLLKELEK